MNEFLLSAWIAVLAVGLDQWLEEPRRWHPLIGFGRWVQWLEQRLNGAQGADWLRTKGGIALLVAVLPVMGLVWLVVQWAPFAVLFDTLLLYLTLGGASLTRHARQVAQPLQTGDLQEARKQVGFMVSRDTETMAAMPIARATIESVLENGNDAIFGTLFWFMVAGVPGAVLYRLVNTLDAMWGYKTPRFCRFGWAAARLDDVLNWVPARLTAMSYALLGNMAQGLRCWWHQGRHWESPNAGPVMAAGAGSLAIRLGGTDVYHGALKERPELGEGQEPAARDIGRAIELVQRTLMMWLLLLLGGGWLLG